MKTVTVALKNRSYRIVIGDGIVSQLGSLCNKLDVGKDAYLITNPLIKKKYARALSRVLHKAHFTVKIKCIPDTEKSKSIEVAAGILKDLARFDTRKRVFIIAFGGGVIGDVSGFVASVYKRGIPYLQVPTTLLAQVDSAIGGKTAVDLREGKNLVGAFYQPALVVSDVRFLRSLSLRQLRSGLAEVIKYAAIKDAKLFTYLERNQNKILSAHAKELEYIVHSCSKIKAGIVSHDEREEKGIRTILNFGHTAGHAIETASGYTRYTHGEAIALGMLIACRMSALLGIASQNSCARIKSLIEALRLPTKVKGVNLEKIIAAHYKDKKFTGRKNRFVLIKNIGRTCIVTDVPLVIIRKAIKEQC